MNYSYTLQICLIFLLLITLIFGRTFYYDRSDEDDTAKSTSSEADEEHNIDSKLSSILNDHDHDGDDSSSDSYEEKRFQQRSMFSSSRPPHTISPQTRQALIDLLQQAVDQGWRPNLKHYVPATRFGRHRR